MAAHDPVGRLKNGTADAPRGRAGLSLPERLAVRNISEAFRELRDPVAIGRALLDVFDGKDPARPRGRARENPDGLPTEGEVPLDWTHRMAAVKLFLEYGYGKALQGIQVQALVEAHHHVHEARPVDLRSLPPEVGAALALVAQAVAGAALGGPQTQALGLPAQPVRDAARRAEPLAQGLQQFVALPASEAGLLAEAEGIAPEHQAEEGELLAGDAELGGAFEVDDLREVAHPVSMRFAEEPVKGNRGPGSAL